MEWMASAGSMAVPAQRMSSLMPNPMTEEIRKTVISIQRAISFRCLKTNFMLAR